MAGKKVHVGGAGRNGQSRRRELALQPEVQQALLANYRSMDRPRESLILLHVGEDSFRSFGVPEDEISEARRSIPSSQQVMRLDIVDRRAYSSLLKGPDEEVGLAIVQYDGPFCPVVVVGFGGRSVWLPSKSLPATKWN